METATVVDRKNRTAQLWMSLFFLSLLVGGLYYPPIGYFMLFCMVAAMGIGAVKGRSWCDWMCPRGSFLDVMLKPLSLQNEVPKFFRHWGFRMAWMTVLMSVLAMQIPPVWGDWYGMGRPFITLLLVTTGIGLFFGIVYHQRIWCMFCPMGTMANVLGRGKHQLKITSICNGCGQCEKVCRMQINPGSFRNNGIVKDGDCLKCFHCIEECQQKALTLGDNAS